MADIKLFDRRINVTVDTIQFEALDCQFTVTKTLKVEPNVCELTIYNLTREHQAQLETLGLGARTTVGAGKAISADKRKATQGIPCRIEAGYAAGTSLVWLGDLRQCQTVRDGADWVTTLTSGDGEKAWMNAREHVSFGAGTSVETAMRQMVRALGIGEGNLSKVVSKLRIAGSIAFPAGKTFSGAVSRHIWDIAQSAGLEVSIQDGALQFLERGKADNSTALRIAADTGMVDSPSVDNKGLLSVTTLMIPGLKCGSLITLDAARLKGTYKIQKITWSADTHEADWTAALECTRV